MSEEVKEVEAAEAKEVEEEEEGRGGGEKEEERRRRRWRWMWRWRKSSAGPELAKSIFNPGRRIFWNVVQLSDKKEINRNTVRSIERCAPNRTLINGW